MRDGPERAGKVPVEEVVESLETDEEAGAYARIARRLLLFGLVAFGVYLVFWRGTHLLFAPRPEAVRPLAPEGVVPTGQPVTLGAVVRNRGWSAGAAFVVAALGPGVGVEGPTVDVPARDSSVVPVRMRLPPGHHAVTLVVFDGWRGVRRLRAFGDVGVDVRPAEIPVETVRPPATLERGHLLRLAVPWTNAGEVAQTVTPVVVFRPAEGGAPVVLEGGSAEVAAGQAQPLALVVDTWPLRPGSWVADVQVYARNGQRVGRGAETFPVEVTAP